MPIFEGNVFEKNKTIGGDNAFYWHKLYESYEEQIVRENTKLSCMGKIFDFPLPQLNPTKRSEEEQQAIVEKSTKITQNIRERFQNAVLTNNISDDRLFTFWKKFIKHRDIYERYYDKETDTQVIFFVNIKQDETL